MENEFQPGSFEASSRNNFLSKSQQTLTSVVSFNKSNHGLNKFRRTTTYQSF